MMMPEDIVIAPIVTEKTISIISNEKKYAFKVNKRANKNEIKKAIEKIFDVEVEGVTVMNVKSKPKRRGVFKGKTSTWKKAIVTLKPSFSIKELDDMVNV
jgi:large subunit ribosomal protein L23